MIDFIKLAQESGLSLYGLGKDKANFNFIVKRFAALVAQAEREACAKVCEDSYFDKHICSEIAKAIRTRDEK